MEAVEVVVDEVEATRPAAPLVDVRVDLRVVRGAADNDTDTAATMRTRGLAQHRS